jgi:hypothetical protein
MGTEQSLALYPQLGRYVCAVWRAGIFSALADSTTSVAYIPAKAATGRRTDMAFGGEADPSGWGGKGVSKVKRSFVFFARFLRRRILGLSSPAD